MPSSSGVTALSPLLSVAVQCYLDVPVTSVSDERLFSLGDGIYSDKHVC